MLMKQHNITLSIVIPVYKANGITPTLVSRIKAALKDNIHTYEIILVDDGCPYNSWIEIEEICKNETNTIGIKFSRNFGQHNAISAGLNKSQGAWIVVMDCDLQDRPEEIIHLYNKAIGTKSDMVFARRYMRHDGFMKILSGQLFYKVFGYLTDTKQDPTIANFGIYSRKVVEAILSMHDQIKYFPTMAQWVGFKKNYLNVEHGDRTVGTTSYNFRKLINLALNNIICFSDKPLRLTVKLGFTIASVSFVIGIYYITAFITGKIQILGFSSIIISIWFLSGIIIFTLGVLGIYIGKTFEKVKDRPIYIIDKIIEE